MLVRFRQDVIDLKPRVVVILAGINDIAGNTGPETLEQIEGNLASMAELAAAPPDPRGALLGAAGL
jgi:lysophospholipase L1-like esterase